MKLLIFTTDKKEWFPCSFKNHLKKNEHINPLPEVPEVNNILSIEGLYIGKDT